MQHGKPIHTPLRLHLAAASGPSIRKCLTGDRWSAAIPPSPRLSHSQNPPVPVQILYPCCDVVDFSRYPPRNSQMYPKDSFEINRPWNVNSEFACSELLQCSKFCCRWWWWRRKGKKQRKCRGLQLLDLQCFADAPICRMLVAQARHCWHQVSIHQADNSWCWLSICVVCFVCFVCGHCMLILMSCEDRSR